MSSRIDGEDVSKWQGRIDWAEARTQTGFVMLKATQGVREVDSTYDYDLRQARHDQIPRGSYHYPDAGDPEAEADWYVQHSLRRNGEMQALDCEGVLLNHRHPVEWVTTWMRRVLERSDNLPLIYMSGSTEHRFDWHPVIKLGCGLWSASWDARKPDPGPWPFVIMWQRDDNGRLRGIDGSVDQDVFFGNQITWAKYANNRADPAAPSAPTPAPASIPVTKQETTPQPEPAHEPSRPAEPYEVQPGDTLTGIAHAHHVTVHQLVAWNQHRYPSLGWNPDLIQIGWHLDTEPAER